MPQLIGEMRRLCVIMERLSKRMLLFIQDCSWKGMEVGILECLDRARRFSFPPKEYYPFCLGVATNFNEWTFCCYYPPVDPENEVSSNNFYISKPFIFTKENSQALDNIESQLSTLVGLIRGLLQPNAYIYIGKM